jgi:ketosteroid isomerase-like protein
MARTTQQVFDAHKQAILNADFPNLLADYANDAVLMTMDGAFVGKEAIQGFFENLFKSQPNPKVSFGKSVVEGDMLLLEWSAESDVGTFPQGVDTFIIQDDKIQRQTMWFTFVPKEA